MKHTYIFLTAILFVAISTNVNAQDWGSTTTPTWTSAKVGLGTGTTAAPSDAYLKVTSNQIGSAGVPEIKIARTVSAPTSSNFFEIWSDLSSNILYDEFNTSGYLGILQTNPSQPLDVGGNALIEQNLAVTDAATIGTTASVGTTLTVGTNLTVTDAATVGANLAVSGTASVGSNLTVNGATTSSKIGVSNSGAGVPTDAFLKIACFQAGSTYVPEFKIARTVGAPTTNNFFEIWNNFSTNVLYDVFNTNGYLGILQSNPSQPLDVAGNALIEQNLAVTDAVTIGTTASVGTNLTVTDAASVGTTLTVTGATTMGSTASVGTNLTVTDAATIGTNLTVTGAATTGTTATVGTNLTVNGTASVGTNLTVNNAAIIGQSYTTGSPVPLPTPGLSTHEYSLYVANGILTEKVKVALSNSITNWSDFVFNKNYKLMPLSKVADYIQDNKHLPEIPSASEVAKDGIDVANMDAKLLQKIEELTLYMIYQQKQIEEQQKEIEALKSNK